jgi:16S rRNA (guanine527-N7)-methyltransferase
VEDLLRLGAPFLGVGLTDAQCRRLADYFHLLLHWNQKIRLIGDAPVSEQVVRHLLDSLAPLPFFPDSPGRLLDIGSGGGLPGLVLKILRPDWAVVLVEAREKKAMFLKQAIRELGLDGAEVRIERLLPHPAAWTGPGFDLVTARALTDLASLLPLAAPQLSPTGVLLAYKGPAAEEEEAQARPETLGLWRVADLSYRLPFLNHERRLLLFKKR